MYIANSLWGAPCRLANDQGFSLLSNEMHHTPGHCIRSTSFFFIALKHRAE